MDDVCNKQNSALVDLVIGGVEVKSVLIDSGASCNVMDKCTWEALKDLFIWGLNVAFNTVQVISRPVVGRAEETST